MSELETSTNTVTGFFYDSTIRYSANLVLKANSSLLFSIPHKLNINERLLKAHDDNESCTERRQPSKNAGEKRTEKYECRLFRTVLTFDDEIERPT
ncbi:hypothetical protein Phum_PHUM551860 [Pediculus humanus corporis]|uniref:Uncharacterized protein n=1 Tax=Pediculus humanus subsp. corporis TaxID=121224 RepID=E0W0G0_PEDHC|nr:uncharacterized protein Phum_PHUM551860 [Pediculus humanus corporis]EEB19116.1 hypothetical protein Phum_PHUM551860 [Pediculus humanus corporis]